MDSQDTLTSGDVPAAWAAATIEGDPRNVPQDQGPVLRSGARAAADYHLRIEQEELMSDALRLRKLSLVGTAAWLFFSLQDLIVVQIVGIGSLLYFWTIRAAGLVPMIYSAYWMHSHDRFTRRQIEAFDIGIFTIAHGSFALMCLPYGGIDGRYFAGSLVALITRASILASPWRRGLLVVGAPVLAFPLTLVLTALVSPTVAAEFGNSHALSGFLQNVFILAASLGICVWAGHGNWSLRRQVFESRSIGKYRLRRCIGVGGMGEIWVAYHSGLRREVALKILRADQGTNPTAVRRFEQEIEATSRLSHPNTVRVLDYGVTDDGLWYYAMELLTGSNLQDLVNKNGPLEPQRALRIALQISRALSEAHGVGIFHRDIKPENVIVTESSEEPDFVKVVDFGIAKVRTESGDPQLTRTGAVLGTPAYISPEAIRGACVDARSDVYGIGGVLFFMVTGRAPFSEVDPSGLLVAHLHQQAPRLSAPDDEAIEADIEHLVGRCLAKDPKQRPSDGTELARELTRLLNELAPPISRSA
jgi:hypothetical protein